MKYNYIPTVNAVINDKDRILLTRRLNTGWKDGSLCIPGGHIEKDENPISAVIRELEEELDVKINKSHVEFLCVAIRNKQPLPHVAFVFIVNNRPEYNFTNNEPEKCSELVWSDMANLPYDIIDDFAQIIKEGFEGRKKYLEIGF